jgi:hypothetical protein
MSMRKAKRRLQSRRIVYTVRIWHGLDTNGPANISYSRVVMRPYGETK